MQTAIAKTVMRAQFKAEQPIFARLRKGDCVAIKFESPTRAEVLVGAFDVQFYYGIVATAGRKGNMVIIEAELPPELT